MCKHTIALLMMALILFVFPISAYGDSEKSILIDAKTAQDSLCKPRKSNKNYKKTCLGDFEVFVFMSLDGIKQSRNLLETGSKNSFSQWLEKDIKMSIKSTREKLNELIVKWENYKE